MVLITFSSCVALVLLRQVKLHGAYAKLETVTIFEVIWQNFRDSEFYVENSSTFLNWLEIENILAPDVIHLPWKIIVNPRAVSTMRTKLGCTLGKNRINVTCEGTCRASNVFWNVGHKIPAAISLLKMFRIFRDENNSNLVEIGIPWCENFLEMFSKCENDTHIVEN